MIAVNMAQGSPNTQQTVESKESYRHSLAVTGMRPGLKGTPYLYTLNLSCPEERWEELFPYYQQAIDSFRLVQPNQVILSPSAARTLFSQRWPVVLHFECDVSGKSPTE